MNIKNNKSLQIFLNLITTLLTTFAFAIDIYNLDNLIKNISFQSSNSKVESILATYGPFKLGTFALLIVGIFFYLFYQKYYSKQHKNYTPFKILAILFSLFMIFGYSYSILNSWDLVFGSIRLFIISLVIFLGYYLFFSTCLNLIYEYIEKYKNNKTITKNKYLNFIFNKHPFASTFIILLICWLPYITAFYPGILSPDPANQIKQFFGFDTKYMDYSIPLDKNIKITNHHPVFHTFILGGLAYLGHLLGSINLGIFFYSILQTTLLISLLSYTISYMQKLNTPIVIRIITLLIYAFVPIFPMYAMSTLKDVMFAIFVIFYIIKLFECIRYKDENYYNFKNILILIILMILITLLRNNGIYLIILSFPFLLFIDKLHVKKILITFFIPVIFYYSFTNILLPTLKITPGSIREVLSIPFQQTARYVKYYENDITKDEKEIIDKVLVYDTLKKRYKPEISDPVKNEFNKNATKEDLKKYFAVWFTQFFKHPNVYLEATLNNTYGYFYPDAKKWYVYFNYDKRLAEVNLNYHYNNLEILRKTLSGYASIFPYIPIFGSIVSIGFNTWLILFLFAYLCIKKYYKYLIYLFPACSLILVCIASPVNTYFRYTLGYIFAIPILIAIFLWIIKNKERSDK